LSRWQYIAYSSLALIMMWIFDCLMIYRCYIIWGKRWHIIVVPSILFFAGILLAILAWLSSPQSPIENKLFKPLLNVALPVNVLQYIITTSLISFRLIRQHRASRASGIQPSHSRINLFHVVRIILESAAIYTVLLIVTIVFLSMRSRNFWILAGMNTPTVGIAFTLISIRIHVVTTRARDRTTLFTVSPWINNNSSTVLVTPSVQSENQVPPIVTKSLPGQ